jgi:hypothetical protein
MPNNRKLTPQEENLLELLVQKSNSDFTDWKNEISVAEMNDGEMGSLKLFPKGISDSNRIFGKQVSEVAFHDSDGVMVIASLNIDSAGELFELDIWKTNFGKLIKFPDSPAQFDFK